jgi:hypothetical protein
MQAVARDFMLPVPCVGTGKIVNANVLLAGKRHAYLFNIARPHDPSAGASP